MLIIDVLYPESLLDMFYFIVSNYLKLDVHFKVCKNCERLFAVLGNSKAEYCSRLIAGSEKTCRRMGAMRVYQSKKQENPIMKTYTKAYKTRNARIRYGTMSREEFDEWSKEARELRDKALEGIISPTQFGKWLDK